MLTDVRVWITIEEVLAYQGHIDLQGTKWFNILGRENILLCFQFNLLVFIFFSYRYEPFLTKEFPCSTCKMDINSFYRHMLYS